MRTCAHTAHKFAIALAQSPRSRIITNIAGFPYTPNPLCSKRILPTQSIITANIMAIGPTKYACCRFGSISPRMYMLHAVCLCMYIAVQCGLSTVFVTRVHAGQSDVAVQRIQGAEGCSGHN